jgi:hypothetical protein
MKDNSDAKARESVHGPVECYIGPVNQVIDMTTFFSALVQALANVRER